MESPRRRRGGAEQPTCWNSVVRFPRFVFPAHPRLGRARLRDDAACGQDEIPREATTDSARSTRPRLTSPPSLRPVLPVPFPHVSCAPHARPARVTSSSRRCVASTPPPATRVGTRAGPSPPRRTIRLSSREAPPRRPPPGTSFPGSARPRRPRSRARRAAARARTPRTGATPARRAAAATICGATPRAVAARRARANSNATAIGDSNDCGARSAAS